MSRSNRCPCPHDPTKNCPCKTAAYDFVPSNSFDVNGWSKMNNLIQVRRINKQSLRIQPNIEFSDNIPPLNNHGYNTALKLNTTASKKILYIGFAVTEHAGKLLIQAVTPNPK